MLPGETAFTLEVPVQSIRDVLHDDVGGVTLQLEVMDPGNVGMVQTGGQPAFPLEGLQVGEVISDRLVDDLYGHDPVQDSVPGPVDRPLTAGGYPFKNFASAHTLFDATVEDRLGLFGWFIGGTSADINIYTNGYTYSISFSNGNGNGIDSFYQKTA